MRIFVSYYEPLQLFACVQQTVAKLSEDHVLGVISNGEEWSQQGKLMYLGLIQYFRYLVFGGRVGYEKPDPRIFHHALTLAGGKPGDAVFVGDRLDVDVAGANAAGMRTIWVNHWGGIMGARAPRPDGIIQAFCQLSEVLASLPGRVA